MNVEVAPGKYIVAVSGGVDSMVLLDILMRRPELDVVVAHFNHGIRTDSGEDEELVRSTAKKHGLLFEVDYGNLGKETSEAIAREARYKFLESVRSKHDAVGIITAHHQDDLIETVFINILRGSGHRGMIAMQTNARIQRPLLKTIKKDVVEYAKTHNITWRDDITNTNEAYLRNYIRINISPKLTGQQQKYLISNIDKVAKTASQKKKLIATISQKIKKDKLIMRSKYIMLPPEVRNELIMYWLRELEFNKYDKKTIEKIDIALKTGRSGTQHSITKSLWLNIDNTTASFDSRT